MTDSKNKHPVIALTKQQNEHKLAPWCAGMSASDLRCLGYQIPERVPDDYVLVAALNMRSNYTHVFAPPVVPEFCLAV